MFRMMPAKVLGFTAAIALAATLLPADARAQGYVLAGGGFEHRMRSGEDAFTYIDFGNGYDVNVAAGYSFADSISVEGEYSYFRNPTNTVSSVATGPQTGMGNVALRVVMGNVRFELPTPVGLYVGGGIGGYKSYLHDVTNPIANQFGFVANGASDGLVFAYQLRAGAKFKVSPHAAVLAGYRYFHGGDLLFLGTAFGDLRPSGAHVHSVEANLKVTF